MTGSLPSFFVTHKNHGTFSDLPGLTWGLGDPSDCFLSKGKSCCSSDLCLLSKETIGFLFSALSTLASRNSSKKGEKQKKLPNPDSPLILARVCRYFQDYDHGKTITTMTTTFIALLTVGCGGALPIQPFLMRSVSSDSCNNVASHRPSDLPCHYCWVEGLGHLPGKTKKWNCEQKHERKGTFSRIYI